MRYELIVAINKKNVIGLNGNLPWRIPEDLQIFKTITERHIVIMGRKTFESLPNGQLQNRINIVLTKTPEKYREKENPELFYCSINNIVTKIDELDNGVRKAIIIGGQEIFDIFFGKCSVFHITLVHNETDGDVIFPYPYNIFENTCEFKCVLDSGVLVSKNAGERYQYCCYNRYV